MGYNSYVKTNEEQWNELMSLPMDAPAVMLNLLKFKSYVPETGLSGEDSYKSYLKEASPYFKMVDGEVIYQGKPKSMLIGPEDEKMWDFMILVRYKTISSFLGMVNTEGYPSELRAQSLEDSRLIYCE